MVNKTIFIVLLYIFSLIFPLTAHSESIDLASKKISKASTQMIIEKNQRGKILKTFLESYNSPLSSYADTFVREADHNNIDWRLLVAISGVESTFGHQIPYNSSNAWGWGIYGDSMITFSSYEEAIKVISKSLREDYMNKWGVKDIYQMGRIYAASPTWAQRVVYFTEKINEFNQKNPQKTLSLSL